MVDCSKLSQKNAPLSHSLVPLPLEELLLELDEDEEELEDDELLEDEDEDEFEDELELLELEEELLLELDELLELEELSVSPPPQAAKAKADSRNIERRIFDPLDDYCCVEAGVYREVEPLSADSIKIRAHSCRIVNKIAAQVFYSKQ